MTGGGGAGRAGAARRWLAAWTGRSPDRADRSAPCRQCGAWRFVTLLRLGRGRARLWCQRCGAVDALTDLTGVRPVRELSGSRAAAVPGTDDVDPALREVMPVPMLAWATTRRRQRPTLDQLDKASICRLYRQWDENLRHTAPEAEAVAGLPAFSTVLGRLDDLCYRTDLVVASLPAPPVPYGGAALWQRVEHARRWLALRGTAQCWMHAGVRGEGLATPPRSVVTAAVRALREGRDLDAALARAARSAMFGADGGPALAVLQRVYPVGTMVEALHDYLASGARPLRDDALARLHAPLGPAATVGSAGPDQGER